MPDSIKSLTPHAGHSPMVLILGTADWNQAIATNQHYMSRELASEFQVIFSESLGLRQPELNRRDISRMFRRLRPRSESVQARQIPNSLEIVKPVILPFHEGPARLLNKVLLNGLFKAWRSHVGPRILWTYSPVTYGFEKMADVTVYHCVDLLGEFPQISRGLIQRGESKLAENANLAIASSAAVEDHLRNVGFPRVEHWPNVADVSLIRGEKDDAQPRVPGRAVFAGNFSEKKVDFTLLRDLVDAGVELHLAGPMAEGGGKTEGMVRELVREGAVYYGHLPLPELAKLYWTSTVGLIPYELNAYTRGVNPLKTFEYLAAGLRVVSTAVPAVTPIRDHVHVATTNTEFVREVLVDGDLPTVAVVSDRQQIADANSWTLRGELARQELRSMLQKLGSFQ